MANIKFSQFTVGNTESDIDFVVGYKGANNIQISPANLLSATLAGYLPLTGGTMTGNVKFNDNIELRLGSGADLKAFHSGTHTYFDNNVGDLIFRNLANDKDIVFQSDDGSGGTATYFSIDGGAELNRFAKNAMWNDNVAAYFGGGFDLKIIHNGSFSSIQNNTGDLKIINYADDTDIIFESDNGSGGTTEYFRLDGSKVDGSSVLGATVFPDNSKIYVGSSYDLEIFHNGVNDTWIDNINGNLNIRNQQNSGDIIFRCDNGNGGIVEYFRLDGSNVNVSINKQFNWLDSVVASFGSSADLQIFHNSTDSFIDNYTGNLTIRNRQDDGDIVFVSDDGSGGITEYFRLDGGAGIVVASKEFRFTDNVAAKFGTGPDMEIYHDGSHSYVKQGGAGDLYIQQFRDDGDILFQSDDGSGGMATYFYLDGSNTITRVARNFRANDNVALQVGVDGDAGMYHDGTNTYIQNDKGDLYIRNNFQDRDIILQSDDGGGGIATYIQIDGSLGISTFYKNLYLPDDVQLRIGTGSDLQIYHNATDSLILNGAGDLYIQNGAADKDILFRCDDGSGGETEYFRLDGSLGYTVVSKHILLDDNVKLRVGSSADMEIYHDGSNSFISDTGTGNLYVRAAANMYFETYGSGKRFASFVENDAVILYNNDVEKLRTIGSGIRISGVSEYADNTAAIAGGLTTGDVYRTGDLLKIVH